MLKRGEGHEEKADVSGGNVGDGADSAAVMAQSEDSIVTLGFSSGVQYQLEACPHAPGEFLVGYVCEDALSGGPTEERGESLRRDLVQHLAYPEIKNDPDPSSRFAAEEA